MDISERAAVTELQALYVPTEKMKRTAVEGRDFYSLSYRYCGKVLIRTEDGELISEAGSVTFMPKGCSYETEITEDGRMALIHFKLSRNIDFRNPAVLNVSDKGVQILFEKTVESFQVDRPLDFSCMASFYELLARLESLAIPEGGERVPRRVARAREDMLASFSDPLFSVSMLAERLGVSTSYLRREFSRAYGKNPVTFLRDLRIANAKNLLQSEYLSIAQIAEQSGFSGASYFIQVFHRTVGESPNKYRQRFFVK